LEMRRCSYAEEPCDVHWNQQVKTVSKLDRLDLKRHDDST
jgi:hypothetical protein